MRVLHVINTLARGGAERLLLDMAPRMVALGCDVHVLVLSLCDRSIYDQLLDAGIHVYVGNSAGLYSPGHVLQIRSMVRRLRIDIVHAHLFPSMLWAAAALAGLSNVVLVGTEHSTWNRRRRIWFWPMERLMYSAYDRIACISPQTAETLTKWLPAIAGKVTVVENGIDLSRFGAGQFNCARSTASIVSIGRLTPQKAFHVLIRAIAREPAATLAIIGDGPLKPELEYLATSLRVNDRVHLLGNRTDIPQLLASATIYVQPSEWEGFGIAAVEAMCAGVPVIASDVPGLREVIGDAGLFFPSGSYIELADRIGYLLDSPGLQAELGRRGHIRAQAFSITRTVDKYVELYRTLVPTNSGVSERSYSAHLP